MIDLDFLEIGTSNFDTCVQNASQTDIGISIEPVLDYFNQLPIKPNCIKLNCAIAFDNTERNIDVYFIPEDLIDKNQLPKWLKGCNCIGDYHPNHRKLQVEHLVEINQIKQYPISTILTENNIRKIKHLKIDTEGGDSDILLHLKNYLEDKAIEFYPEMITFETNSLSDERKVKLVLTIYTTLGYKIVKKAGKGNTRLIRIMNDT